MKVKCIKAFEVEKCDDNGFTLDNESVGAEEGSIWEIEEDYSRIIGGEVRLVKCDDTDIITWLEIPEEMLQKYFKNIKEGVKMRSYLDIIIDLKEGKKPDYEEVRLACLMANDLLHFAEKDIKRVVDPNCKDFVRDFAEKNIESRFRSRKMSPEEFLGNHHPDNPEQQRFMKIGNKLLDKVLNQRDI